MDIIEKLIGRGELAPGARGMNPAHAIEQWAEYEQADLVTVTLSDGRQLVGALRTDARTFPTVEANDGNGHTFRYRLDDSDVVDIVAGGELPKRTITFSHRGPDFITAPWLQSVDGSSLCTTRGNDDVVGTIRDTMAFDADATVDYEFVDLSRPAGVERRTANLRESFIVNYDSLMPGMCNIKITTTWMKDN